MWTLEGGEPLPVEVVEAEDDEVAPPPAAELWRLKEQRCPTPRMRSAARLKNRG